jgi:cell division protein FtsQ
VLSGLAVAAGALYAVGRETSIFAVQTIHVSGGSPRVQAEVRRALAPELGQSLIAISGADVARRVDPLSEVASVRFDRAFPHTLHVTIRAERAVLLVRQGSSGWVVSSFGRVMRAVKPAGKRAGKSAKKSSLPRLWLPASVPVTVGERLPLDDGALAAAAIAPIAPGVFHGGIRTVLSKADELTLVLGSGTQIRLGDIGDLRLKLAVARRIITIAKSDGVSPTAAYVDVSVPERPVLGTSSTSGSSSSSGSGSQQNSQPGSTA